MAKIPLGHKILSCLLAGLVGGKGFHRIASKFFGQWLPPLVIIVLSVLILLVALLYIFRWQQREKNPAFSTSSTLAFWQGVIRFAIAFDLSTFGWQKVFKLQFTTPRAMLDEPFSQFSGEWLTWSYFGYSYPMVVSIGICQLTGAFLLLFRRTRLIGLFVLIPVLLNILLIDIFYGLQLGVTVHAFFLVSAVFYLLLSEYDRLAAFFLRQDGGFPAVTLKRSFKTLLRASVVAGPLLLIALYSSGHWPPELKGKYAVQKIQVNHIDRTAALRSDSVLSVVYLDLANECVFEFRDYQQRAFGTFDYIPQSGQLTVQWHYPPNVEKLEATLSPEGDGRWKLSGKMGSELLTAELKKVD